MVGKSRVNPSLLMLVTEQQCGKIKDDTYNWKALYERWLKRQSHKFLWDLKKRDDLISQKGQKKKSLLEKTAHIHIWDGTIFIGWESRSKGDIKLSGITHTFLTGPETGFEGTDFLI